MHIGNIPATPPTRQQKPRKKMKQGKALEQLEKAIQEHLNSRSNNAVISNAFLIDACGIEREIDVLVHPKGNKDFGIAFECRDHKRKVGLFDIDSFIAKYNDLPQIKKVIVVSTSGFTKDARKKGMHHNIALQSINDLPYSEISKYLNVFRIFSRISICLPYDIVLEDGEKLLPYLLQKVYAVKDNTEVIVRIDYVSSLWERMSYIHDQLCARQTNNAEIELAFIPQEKWYIFDQNNNKQVIKEFRVTAKLSMDAQEQEITEQKLDVASSVRVSEYKQPDGKDLLLVHNNQRYSVFQKEKDGNVEKATVVPQYSTDK